MSDFISKIVQILPIVLMFLVVWMLIIRPQQKKAKEHQDLLAQLKKGDQVLTQAGFLGVVEKVSAESRYVHLRIAPGLVISILRSSITELNNPDFKMIEKEEAEPETSSAKPQSKKKESASKTK